MPGAPSMKMYSRDDLMNMQNFGDDDADEDEDDDETNFPSKLVPTRTIFSEFLSELLIFHTNTKYRCREKP